MVNCLLFSNCYFWLHKKWYLQNFCLMKKWMMLEIVDTSVSKIMTLPNNLVLTCRFQGHNLVFYSLHMICAICFLLNYNLWKLQQESRNTNHELLNWTLTWYLRWGIYTSIPTWPHSQNSLAAVEALSLKISFHGTSLKWSQRQFQSAQE